MESFAQSNGKFTITVAEGLTQMFVAGVSTQKVGEVAQTLVGVAPSASTVSEPTQSHAHRAI